jgi:hypothetical protein
MASGEYKMKNDVILDKEFVKSVLFLMHCLMECLANSKLTPKKAHKMLDMLQGTERLYLESEQRELA